VAVIWKNSLFSCVHQPRKKKRVGFKQTPQERIGDHNNTVVHTDTQQVVKEVKNPLKRLGHEIELKFFFTKKD
jgi:hypothetical protein